MSSPVEVIQRHLEYLKYVGGTNESPNTNEHIKKIPSGQGLEVGILVLPDLLLDVRRFNFGSEEPVFAVGGRAARMACALIHMLGEDDGTYQVNLLTKTGNLGRLLLEDEFKLRSFSNPFLEYVTLLQREGQPRCAIRDEEISSVNSSNMTEESELNQTDLEQPEILELIRKARAICLTSLNTPHFSALFNTLLIHASNQSLFIDSRMSKDPSQAMNSLGSHLLDIQDCNKHQLNKIAALFLRSDQQEEFCTVNRMNSLKSACNKFQIHIIAYGNGYVEFWTPNPRKEAFRIEIKKLDVHKEGVSEYFKAGVILAWSTWQTISTLQHSTPNKSLYELMLNQWNVNKEYRCWPTVLQYAIDLAETRHSLNRSDPCTLKDVIHYIRKKENDPSYGLHHLPNPSVPFDPNKLILQVIPPDQPRKKLVIDNEAVSLDFAELAGRRRIPEGLVCRNLTLCNNKQCIDGQNCIKAEGQEPIAAIMIDLDSTLMDSGQQRKRGLAKALSKLDDKSLDKQIEFFTSYVYNQNDFLQDAIKGFPDIRQKWNHSAWYILYLIFTKDTELKNRTLQLAKERQKTLYNHLTWNKDTSEFIDWLKTFQETYEQVESEKKESISDAISAFEHVQLYPFKEARDLLESLRKTGSFELYIVSEGDPDTQWMKLCRTGLSQYFDRDHVLTTGDAVQTEDVQKALQAEGERLAVNKATIKTQSERLKISMKEQSFLIDDIILAVTNCDNNNELHQVINNTQYNQKISLVNQILKMEKELNLLGQRLRAVDFVKRVINRMEMKSYLYPGAIRAILRNPSFPRHKLHHFDELMKPLSPKARLKFAMVGDRQTKDMQPPADLLGENIVTIRINSLKYAVDSTEIAADRSADPAPHFIVDTLAQAKAILLNKSTWRSVHCSSDPPLFNCKVEVSPRDRKNYPSPNDNEVNHIGLDHVECGCKMFGSDYRMTRKICAGILLEHLVQCNDRERKELFNRYLADEDNQNSLVQDRAALLCSLLRAGLLAQDVLNPWQVPLIRELVKAFDLLQSEGHSDSTKSLHTELRQEIIRMLETISHNGSKEAIKEAKDALDRLGE